MPIYEFRCENCGREFELLIYSSDTEKPSCKYCRSANLTRLLSRFSARGISAGPASTSIKSCSTCPPGKSCISCS
ncbi:MAG: zinc ribbon domain-containing protein [Elusimicrobiota bacterium]